MAVALTEEDIRERFPWDYKTLTARCRERYFDFVINHDYHRIRKSLEGDTRYVYLRRLDPSNPESTHKAFFNANILARFDEHYTKGQPPQVATINETTPEQPVLS